MFFKHRLHRRSQIPGKIYEGVQRFMTNYLIIKQRDNYNVIKTAFTHIAGYSRLGIRLLQIKNCILLIFSSWSPPLHGFPVGFYNHPLSMHFKVFSFSFFFTLFIPWKSMFWNTLWKSMDFLFYSSFLEFQRGVMVFFLEN